MKELGDGVLGSRHNPVVEGIKVVAGSVFGEVETPGHLGVEAVPVALLR